MQSDVMLNRFRTFALIVVAIFLALGAVAASAAAQAAPTGAKPHPGTAAASPHSTPAQSSTPVAQTSTPAQSGNFTVSQLGHAVGTADFHFTRTSTGYDSASTVHVSMKGLEYALSKTEQLDRARHIQHEQLSATVNDSAVNVTGKPDAAQFLLNISSNGHSSTTRLAAHNAAVFLPDFDPGALETLLTVAAAQNGRDLWAILPKQAGSVAPVELATYSDEHGTLNGQPIVVHHLIANIAGTSTDLFAGPDNQLLQAELPQQGFSLVRKGFVLTPPKKPVAPPAQ